MLWIDDQFTQLMTSKELNQAIYKLKPSQRPNRIIPYESYSTMSHASTQTLTSEVSNQQESRVDETF